MLRFFASACLLGSLAGCAAPPHPAAALHAAPASPLGERGTIVATRPVPGRDPQPVRLILARLGSGPSAAGYMEFIVQREDGDLLAVVQPGGAALQRGRRVLILPGSPPRISPLPSVAQR